MTEVEVPEFPGARAFAGAPQFPGSRQPKAAITEVSLVAPGRLTRRDVKRRLRDATAAANAVKELAALPGPGESLHVVMRGNFHFWSIVPAVLALASPATIAELHVATFGTNHGNIANLCRLLDAGDVGRVSFVASSFFRDASASVWGTLKDELTKRGQRCAAIRNHAKIVLFKLSDGRAYSTEGSANMTAANNLEQFALVADEDLRAFHARWIDEAIDNEAGLNAKR